jgi:serine/threonine protein kinase
MSTLIGQRLGQYEITDLLGEGGVALVYRAHQLSTSREVAVKVTRPELIQRSELAQRFEREVQTIAALSHPHILKVFDYGIHENMIYLVTEFLTGGSLDSLIERGPLTLDRTCQIIEQIASALDHAHQRGIIHRDVKPQNVMLDEEGNAFLADFGMVKLLWESKALTQAGNVMGTPAYMAPEQWRGEALDGRADVYGLGVLVFKMLTGQLPFRTKHRLDMMNFHLQEPPPSARNLNPALPPEVDQVIMRALAKDRRGRFESASKMAAALRSAARGEMQQAPADRATRRAGSPSLVALRRAAPLVVVVAVVLLVLLGATLILPSVLAPKSSNLCMTVIGDSIASGHALFQIPGSVINAQFESLGQRIQAVYRYQSAGAVTVYNLTAPNAALGAGNGNRPVFSSTSQYQQMIAARCQFTVIAPWLNDLNYARAPGVSPASAAANHASRLVALTREVVANNPTGRVVVLNYYRANPAAFALKTWNAAFTGADVDAYRQAIAGALRPGAIDLPQVIYLDPEPLLANVKPPPVVEVTSREDFEDSLVQSLDANQRGLVDNFYTSDLTGTLLGDGIHLNQNGTDMLARAVVALLPFP